MDERELIKRCAAAWDDQSLRLALADFLAAYRDGERAELIRLQLGPTPYSKQTHWKIKTLLKDNAQRWCGPLQPKQCKLIGGLLENVSLKSAKDLETLLRWRDVPPIRRVALSCKRIPPRNLQALAESSVLGYVEELTLDYSGADMPTGMAEELAALVAAPALSRLRSLIVYDAPMSADGAGAFAVVEMPPHLESMTIRSCGLDAAAIRAFVVGPWLPRLRRLDLTHNRIDDAGATALANAPMLASLQWLDVSQNALASDGLAAFGSGVLAGLATLRARCHAIGTDGVRGLVAGTGLPSLNDLRIGEGAFRMDPEVGKAIANGALTPQLRTLSLTGGRIGDDGCAALFETSALDGLTQLVLERVELADKTVVAFAASRAPEGMKRLSLDGNFGDRAVDALVDCPGLRSLEKVKVVGTTVSPGSLKALTDRFGALLCAADEPVLEDEKKPEAE